MDPKHQKLGTLLCIGCLIACLATPAGATIISGSVEIPPSDPTATFIKLSVPLNNPFGPPNSVGNDTFQSPNLYGFDESQNTTVLASPLVLDEFSGLATLPVGTVVASHYVFFDPTNGHVRGRVNFDSPVLGIMTTTDHLAASDYLANTGVNYLNPGARGLEVGDSVTISGPNQILFDTFASTPGDYVRVLTAFSPAAAVPEPSALWLLASGGLGLLWVRRRMA
jgi:hypothetical protein